MRTHELKTWPSYFEAVQRGEKTFEVRVNDRDFAVGDLLRLREFDPSRITAPPLGIGPAIQGRYSGRSLERRISYVLHGGQFGIAEGWCVLGLAPASVP